MIALYYDYRQNLKTGDVVEWGSDTIVGKMIRWFTKKDMNHTGAIIRFPFGGLADDRVWTLEALEHGYVLNLMSRRLSKFKGKVWVLRLKDNTKRNAMASELLNFVGTKYDYKSLFEQAFGSVSSDADRLFCSEAVDIALRKVGLLSKNYNNGKRLKPGEFEATGLFKQKIRIF